MVLKLSSEMQSPDLEIKEEDGRSWQPGSKVHQAAEGVEVVLSAGQDVRAAGAMLLSELLY